MSIETVKICIHNLYKDINTYKSLAIKDQHLSIYYLNCCENLKYVIYRFFVLVFENMEKYNDIYMIYRYTAEMKHILKIRIGTKKEQKIYQLYIKSPPLIDDCWV